MPRAELAPAALPMTATTNSSCPIPLPPNCATAPQLIFYGPREGSPTGNVSQLGNQVRSLSAYTFLAGSVTSMAGRPREWRYLGHLQLACGQIAAACWTRARLRRNCMQVGGPAMRSVDRKGGFQPCKSGFWDCTPGLCPAKPELTLTSGAPSQKLAQALPRAGLLSHQRARTHRVEMQWP